LKKSQASKKQARVRKDCIRPGCERHAVCRGLCVTDYNICDDLVREKKTTWEKLEQAGKCLASRRERRDKQREWFLRGKAA